MYRIIAVMAVLGLAVLGVAVVSLAGPADAQDTTEDRLGVVETQIADQATEVSGLRRRVQRLERAVLTPAAEVDNQAQQEDAGQSLSEFAGSGNAVQQVQLEGGLHQISGTVSEGVLQINLYDTAGDAMMSSLIIGPDQLEGAGVVTIDESGEYVLEVQSRGTWTITITKLG